MDKPNAEQSLMLLEDQGQVHGERSGFSLLHPNLDSGLRCCADFWIIWAEKKRIRYKSLFRTYLRSTKVLMSDAVFCQEPTLL